MRYPVLAPVARFFVALALFATLAGPGVVLAQTVDYSRAERFLTWNTERMIAGAEVVPNWMETGDTDRFWYRNNTGSGYEYVLVNPAAGSREPLFDHYRLAGAMSLANDTSYVPDKLPFSTFSFGAGESAIEFTANSRRFTCDIARYACTVGDTLASRLPYVESPDGRWEAFSHEYNLYVRPAGGGDSIQLTADGEKYYAYGYNEPRPNQQRQGPAPRTPTLAWSPDSRYLAVARRDERNVEQMHYISYTSQRPRHFSQPYALPGDSVIPLPTVHIVELEEAEVAAGGREGVDGGGGGPPGGTGAVGETDGADGDGGTAMPGMEATDGDGGAATGMAGAARGAARTPEGSGRVPALRAAANHRVEVAPIPHQLSFAGSAPDSAWSADGTRLHVNYFTRGSQRVFLAEIDAATGTSRVILGDSTRTFVSLGHRGGGSSGGTPSWYVSESGDDVIWWSERDGWAHLYRFDGQGNLRNQITSGPWTVGQALFVDEARQRIYFTARGREPGRNPYYAHLYRIGFDGSGLTLLTPEDANHIIEFSPSGNYFVDTYSRVEEEPVTLLRTAADGRIVRELERADISGIEEVGFIPGEVFSAKARDGITDLYGILYLPPNLDENAKYPIISHIYPGPQRGSVGDWEFKGGGENFALGAAGLRGGADRPPGNAAPLQGIPRQLLRQLHRQRHPRPHRRHPAARGPPFVHRSGPGGHLRTLRRRVRLHRRHPALSGLLQGGGLRGREPRQPQLQHLLGGKISGRHGNGLHGCGQLRGCGEQVIRLQPRGEAAADARGHGRQRPPGHDRPGDRRTDQGQPRLRPGLGPGPRPRPQRTLLHPPTLGLLRAPPAGGGAA